MKVHVIYNIVDSVICKCYIIKVDISLFDIKINSIWLLLYLRLKRHDFAESPKSSHTVCKDLSKICHLSNWRNKCWNIKSKCDQIYVVQLPVHYELSAYGDNSSRHDAHEEFLRCIESSHRLIELTLWCPIYVVRIHKSIVIDILVGKGLWCLNSRNARLYFRDFLLYVYRSSRHLLSCQHNNQKENWHKNCHN